VTRPSPEAFAVEYVAMGRPAIISGCLESWRALSWTIDGLRARIGTIRVQAKVSPSRYFLSGDDTRLLDAGARSQGLGALLDDFDTPELIKPKALRTTGFWPSGAGSMVRTTSMRKS